MALPSPNLDNRSFQQIVDDVKRQISQRCPEWTDHNVSDPGVTLIELFAYMTEMMLFQLNQVPEKNYIKFLELLGVKLKMPQPAKAHLRYLLSRIIDDNAAGEELTRTIPADTVAATQRTSTEDPIEFLTDFALTLSRPRCTYVVSLPQGAEEGPGIAGVRRLDMDNPESYEPVPSDTPGEPAKDRSFAIFGHYRPENEAYDKPNLGDRVCFGFEADISGHVIDLLVRCAPNRGTGLVPGFPSQVWKFWDGTSRTWKPLTVISDSTNGFVDDGIIRLELPHRLLSREIAGHRAIWICCAHVIDDATLPSLPARYGARTAYGQSPGIYGLKARTVGGTVPATNCTRIYNEFLGESDGKPGQKFQTRYAPIHALNWKDTLITAPPPEGEEKVEEIEWNLVPDFSESGPESRHFTCDELTGEIAFGPHLPRPDGKPMDRHGAIPEKGHRIVLRSYRTGGGTLGNVQAGRITIEKESKEYIAEVSNPESAKGGMDMESIDRAKLTATLLLKTRNRAVTKEDFEDLALAIEGVGRACCLQPLHPTAWSTSTLPPGTVELLIIPALGSPTVTRPRDLILPSALHRTISTDLDQRRLLTCQLVVREPRLVHVETEIRLVPDPNLDSELVASRVRAKLNHFIDPVTGGPEGTGWPFGRSLSLTDIYVILKDNLGVAILLDVKISAYRIGTPSSPQNSVAEPIDPMRGLELEPDEVLLTRLHTVRLVPMTTVRTRTIEERD